MEAKEDSLFVDISDNNAFLLEIRADFMGQEGEHVNGYFDKIQFLTSSSSSRFSDSEFKLPFEGYENYRVGIPFKISITVRRCILEGDIEISINNYKIKQSDYEIIEKENDVIYTYIYNG